MRETIQVIIMLLILNTMCKGSTKADAFWSAFMLIIFTLAGTFDELFTLIWSYKLW